MSAGPLTGEAGGRGRIIYIGDPMCSWCYGFAPEIAQLATAAAPDFELVLILGGLRPFTTEPMDGRMREFLEHHWDEVARRTGQPFSKAILERGDFVYDTEPACRAVVTVRNLAPARTAAFFAAVQRAFYAEGRDTNDTATYLACCSELGVDAGAFAAAFDSERMRRLTREDFELTQEMGVRGFPTVLVEEGDRVGLLTSGYAPAAELQAALERFRARSVH